MDRSWRGPRPSEYALSRTLLGYTIAVQAGGVVAAVVAAAIDDGAGVSRGWQAVALGALAGWSGVFTWTTVKHGLRLPVVIADIVVVSLVLLAQHVLVPVDAVMNETTWAIMLAGTTIYVALLAAGQVTGLLLAFVVIAAYLTGVPAETSQIRALFVQAFGMSAILWLLRRGGRRADAVVAKTDSERRWTMVEAARRADERVHRSQMHDSVLATLTMVASGAVPAGSPALRKEAGRALEVLEMFSGERPGRDAPPVDLLERLDDLVAGLSGKPDTAAVAVGVSAPGRGGAGVRVPEPVAGAIIGAAGEALRNVARHSGARAAEVRVERSGDAVTVTVTDRGRGFAADGVTAARLGIRHAIVERMTLVGGRAAVTSRPGAGTEVELRWPRG